MSPATRSSERSCRQSPSATESASSDAPAFRVIRVLCGQLPPCAPRLAASDLARRARARDVAPVCSRPPRLVRFRFRRSLGFRGGRVSVSWRLRCFRGGRGLGPRRARLLLVLLQTAVLILATRSAVARLVAPRSWLALVRHPMECTTRPTGYCARAFHR
jgi:hypothetical protein